MGPTRRAIDQATHDYDATTQHGKTQSAVGGVDVHLDCGGGGGSGGRWQRQRWLGVVVLLDGRKPGGRLDRVVSHH